MNKLCLFLSTVLLFLIISDYESPNTYAATNPIVKIGLYFKATAQNQIDISANKGVVFSAYDSSSGTYSPVYNSAEGEVTTIRKDSYFTNSGLKYTAVSSTGNPTVGPYHIQIQNGNTFSTYNDTLAIIQEYAQKGVVAYPAYTDSGWNIWSGFYVSKAQAEIAIADIRTKLGENTYTTVSEQVDKGIYGVNSTGEVKFMFSASKSLLRGKSLSAENPNPIKIGTGNLNSFRGQVEFLRQTGSDMTIINVLPLEEYLYGVIPNEMESYSHIDALKAQAIAARTFSYTTMNKHAANGFNLCSTTDCHVYKGYASENINTTKAVNETKDMVVTYNAKLAETLYFASSGGRTESVENVWGNSVPYLKSVEDKYESGKSYKYNWSVSYTVDEITQKLKSYNLGTITGIEATKFSESGRPIEVNIRGSSAPYVKVITKDKCRTFLSLFSQWYTINTNANINVLVNNKSVSTQLSQLKVITATGETAFSDPTQKVTIIGANGATSTVSVSPTEYNFVGIGWGHSVGMSQEGARGMAQAGITYDKILAHYYQGTKIEIWK